MWQRLCRAGVWWTVWLLITCVRSQDVWTLNGSKDEVTDRDNRYYQVMGSNGRERNLDGHRYEVTDPNASFTSLVELRPILLSYLTAMPYFPYELDDLLRVHFNGNKSRSTSQDNQTASIEKMNQCYRTHFEGAKISGALSVAIEEVNNDPTLLPGYKLNFTFSNTCGRPQNSVAGFMEHWRMGAKVFIGPEVHCQTEAMMAASQLLPIISYKCKDQTVSDKTMYPTFARTVPAATEITKALMALLNHYNWRKFAVVYISDITAVEMLMSIKKEMDLVNERLRGMGEERLFEMRNESAVQGPFSEVVRNEPIYSIIYNTRHNTRVYVTFGSVKLFRYLLLTMGDLGMMNGDYVLIFLDPDYDWVDVYSAMNDHFYRNTVERIEKYFDPAGNSMRIVKYSQSALAIIPTPLDFTSLRYRQFWNKSNEYLRQPPFGRHVTRASTRTSRVACYLYDAVKLYARALTDLILSGNGTETADYDPVSDGIAIVNRIINTSYTSMQGFDMRIGESGDAEGNYTLLTMQTVMPNLNQSSSYYYPLHRALNVTAHFHPANSRQSNWTLPVLHFHRNVTLLQESWPGGVLPADEPSCGFDGSKCIVEKSRLHFSIH